MHHDQHVADLGTDRPAVVVVESFGVGRQAHRREFEQALLAAFLELRQLGIGHVEQAGHEWIVAESWLDGGPVRTSRNGIGCEYEGTTCDSRAVFRCWHHVSVLLAGIQLPPNRGGNGFSQHVGSRRLEVHAVVQQILRPRFEECVQIVGDDVQV